MFSSTADSISDNFISVAFLSSLYPPFVPLILLTILYFFNLKKICSSYSKEIFCLRDISLKETGPLLLYKARSVRAITAYLPLVDSFINPNKLRFIYTFPTDLVNFVYF